MDESCYRCNPCADPFAMMRGLCYRHAYELEQASAARGPCPYSPSPHVHYEIRCVRPVGHATPCDFRLLPPGQRSQWDLHTQSVAPDINSMSS